MYGTVERYGRRDRYHRCRYRCRCRCRCRYRCRSGSGAGTGACQCRCRQPGCRSSGRAVPRGAGARCRSGSRSTVPVYRCTGTRFRPDRVFFTLCIKNGQNIEPMRRDGRSVQCRACAMSIVVSRRDSRVYRILKIHRVRYTLNTRLTGHGAARAAKRPQSTELRTHVDLYLWRWEPGCCMYVCMFYRMYYATERTRYYSTRTVLHARRTTGPAN
jgi:hypothetical protein